MYIIEHLDILIDYVALKFMTPYCGEDVYGVAAMSRLLQIIGLFCRM